jgi:Holliday junction resolvase RusA-like endonuclease
VIWPVGEKLEFQVRGLLPVPKGNLQAFIVPAPNTKRGLRAVVTDVKSAELRDWERRLQSAAMQARDLRGFEMLVDRPVEVQLVLWLVRPKDHFDTDGNVRGLARSQPHVKPDIDKLQRTIFDALTGCVVDDDSRICRVVVEKRYVRELAQAGVAVRLVALPPTVREENRIRCASSSS